MELIQKFNEVKDYLNKNFLQREEIIDGCLTALVARQHVLLLGPPGTAKTQLISELGACIEGGFHYHWLMTKFTTPEEVFGPVSLAALEKDSYRRVTAGKLPEATTAMLDEVFKASSAILNSLLTIINERKFYNDGQVMEVPLITLFGASNEVPEGDEEAALAAFADRFLLWYVVNYLEEDGAFAKMLQLNGGGPRPVITVDEIKAAGQAAEQIPAGSEIIDVLVNLRRALRDEGITVSDRRWRQSLSLVKAKAFLEGGDKVEVMRDMKILQHALWTSPEQKNLVQKIVRATVDPFGQEIAELMDEAKEVYEETLKAEKGAMEVAAAEANKKFKDILAQFEDLKKRGAEVDKYSAKVQEYNREILAKCLGISF